MDPEAQAILGVSVRDFQAGWVRSGMDPEMLEMGMNLALFFVYEYLPDPPVSPDAPLALAGASWVPESVDRISRLPDCVLLNIISRLPAKDAARTAALASRWRPLWRSAPLTLVDAHFLPDGGAAGHLVLGAPSPRAATEAVSLALAAHPGPFRCVHLTRSNMDGHRGEVARWLDALAAKGVQELVFANRPWPMDLPLPTTIFRCASLTRLYLGVWRLPDTAAASRSAGFPNLRELGLCFNVMGDRDLAFMLDRSPVLEVLTIHGQQVPVRLRIASRSLRCVQMCFCFMEDVALVDAPRLERLLHWTTFEHGSEGSKKKSSKCSRSMIRIAHAPNLRVVGYLHPGTNGMEIGNTVITTALKEAASTSVPSVEILALEVKLGVRNEVHKVPAILRCLPNLQTLHVKSDRDGEGQTTGKVSLKSLLESGPIKCVRQSLKKVVFHDFNGSKNEVAFLKFVAERARVLEEMVVVVTRECCSSVDDAKAKLKPLTCAEWASKACKLQIFKSPTSGGGSPVYCPKLATQFSLADPFDMVYYDQPL